MISRRQFGKGVFGAAVAAIMPMPLMASSKSPALPIIPHDPTLYRHSPEDLIYFATSVAKLGEALLDQYSPARRVLVRDRLPQAVMPKYNTEAWKGHLPHCLSRQSDNSIKAVPMWKNNREWLNYHPKAEDYMFSMGELFEESRMLITGGLPPHFARNEEIIAFHAEKEALHYAQREGERLVTLLDAITAPDKEAYYLGSNPTTATAIHCAFLLVEDEYEDCLVKEIVCNEKGLDFLRATTRIDQENRPVRIWEFGPYKDGRSGIHAQQIEIGPNVILHYVYTAMLVLVDDPRLDNTMYFCSGAGDIGSLAIRQNLCVLPFDEKKPLPGFVGFYEPAYVAQPGYVSRLNFKPDKLPDGLLEHQKSGVYTRPGALKRHFFPLV